MMKCYLCIAEINSGENVFKIPTLVNYISPSFKMRRFSYFKTLRHSCLMITVNKTKTNVTKPRKKPLKKSRKLQSSVA